MKKLGWAAALALLATSLVACMSRDERLAQISDADDRTCLSYGAQKGTDTYVNCRTQLATNRNTASAVRGTAPPGCSQFGNIINCY